MSSLCDTSISLNKIYIVSLHNIKFLLFLRLYKHLYCDGDPIVVNDKAQSDFEKKCQSIKLEKCIICCRVGI